MPVGVITDALSVAIGGFVGFLLSKYLPVKLIKNIPQVFGMAAILISVTLMVQVNSLSFAIICIIMGAVIGELTNFADLLEVGTRKVVSRDKNLSDEKIATLMTVVLLFVFSGTGIFGSLNEGFTGDPSILMAKATLDFFTAVIFGAAVGFTVTLVAIPQFVLSMILYYMATFIMPFMSTGNIGDFKAVGGILTLSAGLKLLDVLKINGLNLVPGLLLAIIGSMLF